MKLGFFLRRKCTFIQKILRDFLRFLHYILWLVLDPSKFRKINYKKLKNILIIHKGAVGDTYNIIGALNRLKTKYPYVNVYSLTSQKNKKFFKSPHLRLLSVKKAKKLIKDKKIDAVIISDMSFYYKMFFDLIKIPCVFASYITISTSIKTLPFFFAKYASPKKTGIKFFLNAFEKIGMPLDSLEFYFTREGEKEAERFIKKNKIAKKEKIIILHVGAGTILRAINSKKTPSHKLPSEKWAEIAESLIEKHNARIIFTGTNNEKPLIKEVIQKIKNKTKIVSSAGKLSIEGVASLLRKSCLLISIDTSMAHIGAQTGVPVIDLFGPFPPEHAYPLTNKKKIIFHQEVCNSCRKYFCPEENAVCMKAITSKEIIKCADKFLRGLSILKNKTI